MLAGTIQALELPNVIGQVVVMPAIEKPHNMTPVTAALWQEPEEPGQEGSSRLMPSLLSPLSLADLPKCEHLSLNMTRAVDFDHQFGAAEKKYLNDIYPDDNQFYLAVLGTHPDYQRRGAGGALVRSGLEYGTTLYDRGVNVTATLIATDIGEPLYAHMGWESMKNFTVKSLDKKDGRREKWRFDVMRYEF